MRLANAVAVLIVAIVFFAAGYFWRPYPVVTGAMLEMRVSSPSKYGGSFAHVGHFSVVRRGRAADTLVIDACEEHNELACDHPLLLLVEKSH